jgi:hypothetical protein
MDAGFAGIAPGILRADLADSAGGGGQQHDVHVVMVCRLLSGPELPARPPLHDSFKLQRDLFSTGRPRHRRGLRSKLGVLIQTLFVNRGHHGRGGRSINQAHLFRVERADAVLGPPADHAVVILSTGSIMV